MTHGMMGGSMGGMMWVMGLADVLGAALLVLLVAGLVQYVCFR